MVEGRAVLGMGIYRGFTGLVTKPVEGAKSKSESDVLCSVLLHTLHAYDLLLTAYKSHGPKIRSACHLPSQQFQ